MTDRELMQQALEALENALSDDQPYIVRGKEVITALRERLAQPEQEPTVKESLTVQPEQELVCVCGAIWEGQELVSIPPRQWQGLTEAEKVNVAIDCGCADVAWMDFADAIEAKLKEKNHG